MGYVRASLISIKRVISECARLGVLAATSFFFSFMRHCCQSRAIALSMFLIVLSILDVLYTTSSVNALLSGGVYSGHLKWHTQYTHPAIHNKHIYRNIYIQSV